MINKIIQIIKLHGLRNTAHLLGCEYGTLTYAIRLDTDGGELSEARVNKVWECVLKIITI